jgi:hypothetical protein
MHFNTLPGWLSVECLLRSRIGHKPQLLCFVLGATPNQVSLRCLEIEEPLGLNKKQLGDLKRC